MLALTWPMTVLSVACIFGVLFLAFLFLGIPLLTRSQRSLVDGQMTAIPTAGKKLDKLTEDVAALRTDIADLKNAVAELDRMFKSVG